MTDLVESSTWTPGIRQFETSDPVEGGPDGIDNVPLRQLANRTRFLKDAHDALVDAKNPYPQYATIVQMQDAIKGIVASAPGALDTLNELAAALGNDPNFATTMTNALALKAPIDSPALTGAPKAPTPQQFDNSTKLATTAFVRQAFGNMSGASGISGATTLTTADAGAFRYFSGSSAYNVSVPSTSTVPDGTMIGIGCNNTAGITLVPQGSDKFFPLSGALLTSFGMGYGENVFLIRQGGSWIVAFGSASNWLSTGFFASLAANGYQKLPSGLIIQWGGVSVPANTTYTYNFPIAFPSACYSLVGSRGAPGSNAPYNFSPISTSQFQAQNFGTGNEFGSWIAIGR
ncbi:gp53-like domain-containing protein [Burkholderia ubonensis]|uniref:gp53-like domain-containing protein n=1 Tax=Burkholderia ubonensis TaxID=101571 RepID=UPI00075267DD|nr:hypothetical protein [Burkholderia ubonensis]KVZ49005.1 hypothetical protein WL19_16545 [Burkholderia ubonensis]